MFDKYEKVIIPLIALAIVSSVAALVWLLVSLADEGPKRPPLFQKGQMVAMKAFGETGMVVGHYCFRDECFYDVRFKALQMHTASNLIGSGGPVTLAPVALVQNVREFELVPAL